MNDLRTEQNPYTEFPISHRSVPTRPRALSNPDGEEKTEELTRDRAFSNPEKSKEVENKLRELQESLRADEINVLSESLRLIPLREAHPSLRRQLCSDSFWENLPEKNKNALEFDRTVYLTEKAILNHEPVSEICFAIFNALSVEAVAKLPKSNLIDLLNKHWEEFYDKNEEIKLDKLLELLSEYDWPYLDPLFLSYLLKGNEGEKKTHCQFALKVINAKNKIAESKDPLKMLILKKREEKSQSLCMHPFLYFVAQRYCELSDLINFDNLAKLFCQIETNIKRESSSSLKYSMASGSLFPVRDNVRDGDPIADDIRFAFGENCFLCSMADGCGWGNQPKLSAEKANNTFIKVLKKVASAQDVIEKMFHVIEKAHKGAPDSAVAHCGIVCFRHKKHSWKIFISGLGDMKVYCYLNGTCKDLTKTRKKFFKGVNDPGGCIGGSFLDLRNFGIYYRKLPKEAILIPMSNGIHDNLDPFYLNIVPYDALSKLENENISFPESYKEKCGINWNQSNIHYAVRDLYKEMMVKKIVEEALQNGWDIPNTFEKHITEQTAFLRTRMEQSTENQPKIGEEKLVNIDGKPVFCNMLGSLDHYCIGAIHL